MLKMLCLDAESLNFTNHLKSHLFPTHLSGCCPSGQVVVLSFSSSPSVDTNTPLSVSGVSVSCCPPLPCSPANKQPEIAPRRAGTINKKQHSMPNFQPPLPPIDAGEVPVFDPPPLSPTGRGLEAGQAGAAVPQTHQPLVQQPAENR